MIIVPANRLDISEIVEIDALAHRGWSEKSWRSQLDAENCRTLVAHGVSGEVLGVASFSVAFDTADLLRVAVRPQLRRLGIGRELVEAGMEWATYSSATRMMLEVAHDNGAAIALYQALGFQPISIRSGYYGSGVDAVVMERDLVALQEWELIGALDE